MNNIVIIGGGFAGINLANGLAGKAGYHVTLVDRNNYHFFPPLLYQVSTGFLEPSNISYPLRKLFRKADNISFRLGELQQVVPAQKKVILSTGELYYDFLVIASGAATNYFGMANVQRNALPMKTLNDALGLRNHLLAQLEKASMTTDAEERKKYLNIVVAGGGPTGVEISGMLADMKKHIFARDYPELAPFAADVHIYLVEGLDAVLKTMSERSQRYTRKTLLSMGVEIKLNTQVRDYTEDKVFFANGDTIPTKTLIWAAGIAGTPFAGITPESYGRGKRLQVNEYNEVLGMPGIFAIGDCCIQTADKAFPNGHPQLAQVGIQQGTHLAKNFLGLRMNHPMKPFSYWDKGSMAIIGRNKAVVDLPKNKGHFQGFIAWFVWLFIHLISLVARRNKVTTFYNWSGAYITKDPSLRLIIRPSNN